MSIAPELKNDPTYKKYHLSCKTKFHFKTVTEDIGRGVISSYARKLVLLVPQESDQRSRFLSAWCPDTKEEFYEVAAEVGAPVHGPVRLSVHRGYDDKLDRPYLFVMSKGVEEILLDFPEGRTLEVTILPANMDGEADYALDSSDGNYEAVQ